MSEQLRDKMSEQFSGSYYQYCAYKPMNAHFLGQNVRPIYRLLALMAMFIYTINKL